MKMSNNFFDITKQKGECRKISSDLHLDFVLFVHEPLSRDFYICYGFSLTPPILTLLFTQEGYQVVVDTWHRSCWYLAPKKKLIYNELI